MTKIQWADHTWNPITGCSKISPGCLNCYAEKMAKRLAGRYGYPKSDPFKVTFHPNRLQEPIKFKKGSRVFVCSMSDIFHDKVSIMWIDIILQTIRDLPNLTFMLLTKRPENALKVFGPTYPEWWGSLPNLWIGVTAENQEQADKRIPLLLQIPAAKRFVSVEPMLEPVTLRWLSAWPENDIKNGGSGSALNPNSEKTNHLDGLKKLDWVIAGCESGHGARNIKRTAFLMLKNQCVQAGVPFFCKQIFNEDYKNSRVSKKIIKMPELDNQVWDQIPK